MRIENNNNEVIHKLTIKSLQSNKLRNIIALIAIILTTFMIATIFCIGSSFIKNQSTLWIRVQGTTATVKLNNPTIEQIELLKQEAFEHVGYEINAGIIVLPEHNNNNNFISFVYSDTINFTKQRIPAYSDITGSYPLEKNEIMASYHTLHQLGIDEPALGMEIMLTYKNRTAEVTESFRLTGLFRDYTMQMISPTVIYVSNSFIQQSGITIGHSGVALMTLNKSKRDLLQNKLNSTFPLQDNQKFHFNNNPIHDIGSVKNSASFIVVMICLFIVVSGYLLIYNVFYISVIKQIHFYGLLKTIGTSPKQIKKIVRNQAFYLAAIGIPIGLLLAVITSFGIIPFFLASIGSETNGIKIPTEVYFHPFIFIGSTLFALLAVILSYRKPASIAGKISPVEATRYTGMKSANTRKNKRKSLGNGKLYRMAFHNIFRDKKRSILVFISLFLGIVSFLCLFTALDTLKVENFINQYYMTDFRITNRIIHGTQSTDMNDLLYKIKDQPGVYNFTEQKITRVYVDFNEDIVLPFLKLDQASFSDGSQEALNEYAQKLKTDKELSSLFISNFSTESLKKMNKQLELPINIDSFIQGEVIILSSYSINHINDENFSSLIGKTLTVTDQGSGIIRTYTIGAIVPGNYLSSYINIYQPGRPNLHVSEQEITRLNNSLPPQKLLFDVEPTLENEMKTFLKSLVHDKEMLDLSIKSDMAEEFKQVKATMNIMGSGMSFLLILIGLINFINIMITGVNARLKEFAILESIGMTKKQIGRMISLEGLYYFLITSILILTIGSYLAYLTANGMVSIANYAVFSFPILPLIIVLLIIFVICIVVPPIVFRLAIKSSVSDRLNLHEV